METVSNQSQRPLEIHVCISMLNSIHSHTCTCLYVKVHLKSAGPFQNCPDRFKTDWRVLSCRGCKPVPHTVKPSNQENAASMLLGWPGFKLCRHPDQSVLCMGMHVHTDQEMCGTHHIHTKTKEICAS